MTMKDLLGLSQRSHPPNPYAGSPIQGGAKPKINEPVQQLGPFKDVQEKADKKVCTGCSKQVTKFRDDLSQREYLISGLCQACQDEVFAPPEDDE
jgi:hypothetical protein